MGYSEISLHSTATDIQTSIVGIGLYTGTRCEIFSFLQDMLVSMIIRASDGMVNDVTFARFRAGARGHAIMGRTRVLQAVVLA